jgi:hypothetical protein
MGPFVGFAFFICRIHQVTNWQIYKKIKIEMTFYAEKIVMYMFGYIYEQAIHT